jgi:hypothetical protein
VLIKTIKALHADEDFRGLDHMILPTPPPDCWQDNFCKIALPTLPSAQGDYCRGYFANFDRFDKYVIVASKTTGIKARKKIGVITRRYPSFDIFIDKTFEVGKNDMTNLAFMIVASEGECGYLLKLSPEGKFMDYDMLYYDQAQYLVKRWIEKNMLNK